ncbi:hypothetical protein [Phascolarctobacterium sp.]|uniref:hypothetical protein n=1 Tax=Phascolarctobacterium sp. TaxID=2049039 RepID=UPI00386E5616
MKEALFAYVQKHIDEDGIFTEEDLPDYEEYPYHMRAGHSDAFYYTTDMPTSPEDAERLVKLLLDYMAEPIQPHRQELYNAVKHMSMAEYCDVMIDSLDKEAINESAYDLARRFFYNARHREPVKLALLLFGIYGMHRIYGEDQELWRDMVTMAHCEEFTFAFLYSCRMSNFINQKAVWELLGCTKGWGKVFCIIDCQCRNDAERLWLLKNGPDIDVEYPPLAVKLLQETRLEEYLQQPSIGFEEYKSAFAIIGNFLIMLLRYEPEALRENYNLETINIYTLVERLLHHASYHAVLPEDLLDVANIGATLRNMQDEERFFALSPNQFQELIAHCDKLVYSQDWRQEIDARLIENGRINYQLADFAYELEIDVWQRLFDFWQEHPEEINLMPYLLAYEGGERPERVLAAVLAKLPQLADEPLALVVPLHYLQNHPGEGEALICAGLNSINEMVRSCACDALEEWGAAYLTPMLRKAVIQAIHDSTEELLKVRLAAVLAGRKLDMEAILRKLKKSHPPKQKK